ncbi:MAG TPA: hypothetical protein VFL29_03650 [Candidatus Dormibacteraeota bacterium]|nr:hypothetical protein [Candidatus Dormibacteraeota bacterium]
MALFALASCGEAAFTMSATANGQTTYVVVSGNPDDVAQMKAYCEQNHCVAGQIEDGDHHSGNLICEHDSAKNGHHLHFALYGGSLSPAQCEQIFASFP